MHTHLASGDSTEVGKIKNQKGEAQKSDIRDRNDKETTNLDLVAEHLRLRAFGLFMCLPRRGKSGVLTGLAL